MDNGILPEHTVDPLVRTGDENPTARAVAFPENNDTEEKPMSAMRTKGNELKRQLTQEEKDLAAAGYEHLEEQKVKKSEPGTKLDQNVDLNEHHLALSELGERLNISIDLKDPNRSSGLTPEEAAARLVRDGQNILTPPKKKSALRKVRRHLRGGYHIIDMISVSRLSFDNVQYLTHHRGLAGVYPASHPAQGMQVPLRLH